MNKKKFDKKLVLNKKTIAHLAKCELNAAKGGWTGAATCGHPRTCPLTGSPICIYCAYPV